MDKNTNDFLSIFIFYFDFCFSMNSNKSSLYDEC